MDFHFCMNYGSKLVYENFHHTHIWKFGGTTKVDNTNIGVVYRQVKVFVFVDLKSGIKTKQVTT